MIEDFPRVALGHWPTPLEPLLRLQATLGGPCIWMKRDDCSGLATGGNKTRKLEFLLGDALEQGAAAVVTFGAVQSNHCRQTAAACAAIGMPCHLILSETVDRHDDHYKRSGNRLLDDLFGATVHEATTGEEITRALENVAATTTGELILIEPGGSNPVGTRGYIAAAIELQTQLADAGATPDRVVTAASTGGTAAGLAIGFAGTGITIEAACVLHSADATAPVIDHLIGQTTALLDPSIEVISPVVTDAELGPGYGIVTDATDEAIRLVASTEGMLLDPVYSGKAMADVIRRIRSGELTNDLVFIHTGGSVGLFAYTETLAPPTH